MSVTTKRPPRENLVRAVFPGVELRAADDGGMPTLVGHFSVFNEWTEINSAWEGRFLERVAPGAYSKTFKENRSGMRALFQHGRDPQVGDKPLGSIDVLREDPNGKSTGIAGAYYEVPLFDTNYNRELLPGLEAGVYGASFRFQVMREEIVDSPGASAYNPNGLPERTIKEARVMEFGPVTFPAYASATAGVRSLTDEFLVAGLAPERLGQVLSFARKIEKRMDVEDIDCLADMIALAVYYINEQDEPGDEGNVAPMQGVIATLVSLMNGEVTEPEPADEAEDEEVSQDKDGAERAAEQDDDAPSEVGAEQDAHPDEERRDQSEGEYEFWFARR